MSRVSASSPGRFCAYSEPLPRKRRRRAFPVDFLITAAGAAAIVALLVAAGWLAGRITAALVVGVCTAALFVGLGVLARTR
jgi:fatty acid desaturase